MLSSGGVEFVDRCSSARRDREVIVGVVAEQPL